MRILLDECIDENLRHGFAGHECHTCRYAGLKGLANGELLAAAEQAGYDVLITVDKNIPHQQNLRDRGVNRWWQFCSLVSSDCTWGGVRALYSLKMSQDDLTFALSDITGGMRRSKKQHLPGEIKEYVWVLHE